MATVIPGPAALDLAILSLYCSYDTALGGSPIYIFYGPSTTTNSTLSSSWIQAHIFSVAGYKYYPRLTIAPTSSLYAAVHLLPEQKQGEELYRGFVFSLAKYFGELSATTQDVVKQGNRRSNPREGYLFGTDHVANVVSSFEYVENAQEVADILLAGLATKSISWIDVDVVLPEESMRSYPFSPVSAPTEQAAELDEDDLNFGRYTELVQAFGISAFLPTSKLRRAPSKPTSASRTRVLGREQKIQIRHEMQEFLQTERNYVHNLGRLCNNRVVEFCRKTPSTQEVLHKLFPASCETILALHSLFLQSLEEILTQTELDAPEDLRPKNSYADSRRDGLDIGSKSEDRIGTDRFAKLLLGFVPQFIGPYQQYITASACFSNTLVEILGDNRSELPRLVREIGEQRLRSWLIEPVQRLPRYLLFIENLTAKLPAAHPATSQLLEAKDILVGICDSNGAEVSKDVIIERLRDMCPSWPKDLQPNGRLVSIAEALELGTPFTGQVQRMTGSTMILVFTDCMVNLRKPSDSNLSARGLAAEFDRPRTTAASNVAQATLSFDGAYDLLSTEAFETGENLVLYQFSVSTLTGNKQCLGDNASVRAFHLQGAHEGKTTRFIEEIVRARIEARFPESMRDNTPWALRYRNTDVKAPGIYASIFPDDQKSPEDYRRTAVGRVTILVDQQQQTETSDALSEDSDSHNIVVRITHSEPGIYLLDFQAVGGHHTVDKIRSTHLQAVLLQRICTFLKLVYQVPSRRASLLEYQVYSKLLQSTQPRFSLAEDTRRHRPISPVKMLSGMFGSSDRGSSSPKKQTFIGSTSPHTRPFSTSEPSIPPYSLVQPHSGLPVNPFKNKVVLIGPADMGPSTISSLEDTLRAYMIALQSRSGNVVGKVLRGRETADELDVNELYNTLLEEPTRLHIAAQAPVDVLFCAFEKFLNNAWADRMGPIIPTAMINQIQAILDTYQGRDCADRFRRLLADLPPQNYRAFVSILKLLEELLDASGNDGDRGALTLSFTEALVESDNPQRYIMLFDRLVDDFDFLFGDTTGTQPTTTAVDFDSVRSKRSANTSSISSGVSSLRKRFGLGFGSSQREHNKNDTESSTGGVWRTLSKKASGEGESQPGSLSRSFLSRSRSKDKDNKKQQSRPVSRDQPHSIEAEYGIDLRSRPGSSHTTISNLLTNGEGRAESVVTKKKRRSSLSDLTALRTLGTTSLDVTQGHSYNESGWSPDRRDAKAPRTPSPQRILEHLASPENPPPRFGSLLQPSRTSSVAEKGAHSTTGEVTIQSFSPKKRDGGHSGIPVPGRELQERISPGHNQASSPRKVQSSPQKMAMQSPQKLHERLATDKKALEEGGALLQAELRKIGQELTASELQRNGSKYSTTQARDVNARYRELERFIATELGKLRKSNAETTAIVESSLVVSEKKARCLDELYREANAENEALYERFNSELSKVLKSVRAGNGVEEAKAKMTEAEDEAMRLRKENQRLKREVLGLRSQLKE